MPKQCTIARVAEERSDRPSKTFLTSFIMSIVNGTFVPDKLGDPEVASQQVFDMYSKKDMSDYAQAAYNFIQKQQEQAFTLDMWNLVNEYNNPASQMARYQNAGLNPNLIYSQSNTANQPGTPSAAQFRSSGTYNKSQQVKLEKFQSGMQAIGQIMNTVKAARETYDYMKYGRTASALQNELDTWRIGLLSGQETAQKLANDWNMFLQGRLEFDPEAPAVKMYRNQSNVQEQRYEQLKALVNMIPDQQERIKALKELDAERLSILQSQTGFITNFNTGHPEFDSFFKMLAFFVMNSGT